jgi:hypothetical protein
MTRKFKALGLALVAVFAMSAIAAASAQAVDHTFKSGTSPTNFTGVAESEHVFTIDGGSVSTVCETILFEGTEVGAERDTITVSPTYDDCESAPFGEAKVTENHCAYEFDSDTTKHGGEVEHAPVKIECQNSKIEIEVPSVGITVSVGAQENLHGVRYDNIVDPSTEKEAVTVDATVEGIAWTCAPAFLCGLGGVPSSGTDGTYDGEAIVTGFVDNGEPQEGTDKTTPELNHGAAVDVTMLTP